MMNLKIFIENKNLLFQSLFENIKNTVATLCEYDPFAFFNPISTGLKKLR